MTKGEHYQKAEEHLRLAGNVPADSAGWMWDRTRYHLAAAQVHAILASVPPVNIVYRAGGGAA